MYLSHVLAANIRKFRKARHLTQTRLAEELFVTPQNVSKWETGISSPDIHNLYKLASLFSVSTDQLLGISGPETDESIMIAIDGGGTKTEFVLFSEKGKIFGRKILQGSNPNSCGMESTLSVLKSGLDYLMAINPNVSFVYAGISGCALKENQNGILTVMNKIYPDIGFEVQSDTYNAIYCSEEVERLIGVICGTGSVICAKTPKSIFRIGGWGYLFDCGGSGFDLGRDAIRAALAQFDGIGKKTLITDLIENNLKGKILDKLSFLYATGKDYIAQFSKTVFEAYRNGDEVAGQILEQNTDRLMFLIRSAAQMYDCGKTVMISGGLVSEKDVLSDFLERKSNGEFRIVFNELPPIYGACAYCCRLFGKRSSDFQENFKGSYFNY